MISLVEEREVQDVKGPAAVSFPGIAGSLAGPVRVDEVRIPAVAESEGNTGDPGRVHELDLEIDRPDACWQDHDQRGKDSAGAGRGGEPLRNR